MAGPSIRIDAESPPPLPEGRTARAVALAQASWAAIRRHRIILFVTMATCVLAGIIFILLSTPDYRATASVEVEDVPAGAAGAGAIQRPVAPVDNEALMQTELEVLRSRALAEDVARELALVGSRTFFDGMDERRPERGSGSLSQRQVENEAVIRLLRDNLNVELPGKSRVIRISFTSSDPVLSARVANSYADSLIRADLKRGFESAYRRAVSFWVNWTARGVILNGQSATWRPMPRRPAPHRRTSRRVRTVPPCLRGRPRPGLRNSTLSVRRRRPTGSLHRSAGKAPAFPASIRCRRCSTTVRCSS
jgi:capsular polysaccharide biosynthesis protein